MQKYSSSVSGLYVHLPFCRRICPFCGFPVLRDRDEKRERYIVYLEKELRLLAQSFQFDYRKLKSVYFGGGTPSRFSIDQLSRMVECVGTCIGSSPGRHWSIEVNPEDIEPSYARALRQIGFDRVSVGVQSFHDASLTMLGRFHSASQAHLAVERLQNAGFHDMNLDLIFGYPDQTPENFQEDLRQSMRHAPTHTSVYCLAVEPKTKINRFAAWRQWQIQNEDLISSMYRFAVPYLQSHRMDQYEISNFAKVGYRSLQNAINWSGENYLGIGLGAHSHVDSKRWGNERRWLEYRNRIDRDRLPLAFWETLSKRKRRDERLMIQLRLKEGVDVESYAEAFGVDLFDACRSEIRSLQQNKLIETPRGRLRLTVEGMLLADEIAAMLSGRLPDTV